MLGPWGHPGGSWEQHEGHAGVRNQIFGDFGIPAGELFGFSWVISYFFFGLVSRSLPAPMFVSKSGRLGLSEPGFRTEGIAKKHFVT